MDFKGPDAYELLGAGKNKVFSVLASKEHLPQALSGLLEQAQRFYPEILPAYSEITGCGPTCSELVDVVRQQVPKATDGLPWLVTRQCESGESPGFTVFIGPWDIDGRQVLMLGDKNLVFQLVTAIKGQNEPPEDTAVIGWAGENPRFPVPMVFLPGYDGPILIDRTRCTNCGMCVDACPVGLLGMQDGKPQLQHHDCIQCMACVEVCNDRALLPVFQADRLYMTPDVRAVSPDRLGAIMRPELRQSPPDFLLPGPRPTGPVYVLGLAVNTMQENAAVLLRDGKVIRAVEEERLNRIKHYGYKRPGTADKAVCNDLSLPLETALPYRSIDYLLGREGLDLERVDYIAINGIPARFRRSYDLQAPQKPPAILHSNRVIAVPHHLCHAASAFYPSGMDEALVVTVDGRGDRETAAVFRGKGRDLELLFDLPALEDSSIGGVYETITRILGLGSHGQGSTMALASFGKPIFPMEEVMSFTSPTDYRIHEKLAYKRFAHLSREYHAPILDAHKDLAASIQQALETTVSSIIRYAAAKDNVPYLALAGGVALNCRMNEVIRQRFNVKRMFVQPAANDAGTALGAALIAWREISGERPKWQMEHAYLGPEWSFAEIKEALNRFGLAYRRTNAREIAKLLAEGFVIGQFEGAMEFGPRALGHRSIIADPRNEQVKDRLNVAKGRQSWRPFAPSVLAGQEERVMHNAHHSPYMLFALEVKEQARKTSPAIVHVDHTTRPQSVGRDQGKYAEIIHHFQGITGLPWILNTSFNTAAEPIVASPQDAIWSFLHLNLDYLSIGDFLVKKGEYQGITPPKPPQESGTITIKELAGMTPVAGPCALMLRLTATCPHNCAHCPMRDLKAYKTRSLTEVAKRLQLFRNKGCTEVMFLRGDPLGVPWILKAIHLASALEYKSIGIQTPGDRLRHKELVKRLKHRGLGLVHLHIFGPDPDMHDRITGTPGSFAGVMRGIENLLDLQIDTLVEIPVTRRNYNTLPDIVQRVMDTGVKRIHISHARPVFTDGRFFIDQVVRLNTARKWLNQAIDLAAKMADVSTEGIPLCILEPRFHVYAERSTGLTTRFVDDFTGIRSLTQVKDESQHLPASCNKCLLKDRCPGPWALYQYLAGDGEFVPFLG